MTEDTILTTEKTGLRESPIKHIEWSIQNFFDHPDKVDYKIESPCVSLSDSKWYIRIYTNGETNHSSSGWIGLYLERKKSTAEHHISFKIGINKADGSNFKTLETSYTFRNKKFDYGWGYTRFVERSKLLNSKTDVVSNGTLTVFCTFRILDKTFASFENTESSSQTDYDDLSPLSDDLKNIYINKRCTDVTLIVKNEEFPVHRAILVARSPVFASMFGHNMSERNSGNVEISDCDPSSFEDFLFYLYTGRLDNLSLQKALNLYKTADKYDVKAVKNKCIQIMRRDLCVDLFCDVTHLAVMYKESGLLTDATNFFIDNAKAILSTGKWLQFLEENASLGNELLLKLLKSKN